MPEDGQGTSTLDYTPPSRVRSRFAQAADCFVSMLTFWSPGLSGEMCQFCHWLEDVAFPQARQRDQYEIELSARHAEGSWRLVWSGEAKGAPAYEVIPLRRLPAFLGELGIRQLVLDTELESNQVQDVLRLLLRVRSTIRSAATSWFDSLLRRNRVLEAITSDQGLHMSCAQVTLDRTSGTLRIVESYCPLTFSRVVKAYESKVSRFRDHRAFFYAAPRYALAAAAAILAPVFVAALLGFPPGLIVATSVVAAGVIGFGTYVLFQTIGSEEYDKEHQAKELERRHKALVRAHQYIESDLESARRIQRKFIPGPQVRPFPESLAFAHAFAPEMAVGGDYYDLKQIDSHRVAVLLADVCGHGMSAAFITGLIKTTFEFSHLADRPTNEFVAEVNEVIERLTPPESFAAVIFAIYDVNNRMLCYTNAGHSPVPMIVRAGSCEVESLYDAGGMIAGITLSEPYEEGKVLLAPGDKMVLCTDGLTDAENRQEVRFGRERLLALLREHAKLPALGLCEQIMQEIARHTDGAVQTDDRALLIMEVLN